MKCLATSSAAAILCALLVFPARAHAQENTNSSEGDKPYTLIVYGGVSTWRYFGDSLDFKFLNTKLIAAAVDRTIYSFDFGLSFEAEVGAGRRFGKDNFYELWATAGIRWTRFPWNHIVSTTLGAMLLAWIT
jgi:hypothetical protein